MPHLSDAEITRCLPDCPGWAIDDGSLVRTFRFADFVQAFAFMTEVAFAAERANHHPDWHNVYRTVTIRLSTHDAGGLTDRDVVLAQTISTIASRYHTDP